MKPFFLLAILLLAVAPDFFAAPVQTESTLADLGVLAPDRLSGPQARKDYYLPLPTRIFNAAASRVRVEVQPSPFLHPGSVVGIWINDRPVDTVRVGKGGAVVVLSGAIPPGTRADDPTRNILKLTVKADLGLVPGPPAQEPSLDRAAAWIDVLPSSKFDFAFDNAAPDWLSIGRLAITMRPRVEIAAPPDASPLQTDLALKLTSWVARNSPRSELHFADAASGPDFPEADRFVVGPRKDGEPQLEIVAENSGRTVHVRANSGADAAGVWNALQLAERVPLPGNRWVASSSASAAPAPKNGALLRDLDPGSMALNKGAAQTVCTIHFDRARLTRTPADLALHLSGATSPSPAGAEPALAVFLNGRLVFSDRLAAGAKDFDYRVVLPAAQVRGNNELAISMIPAAESPKTYFWQLNPESSLRTGAAASPVEPLGLLDAALRFAEGPSYQVWLAKPGDWKIAAYAVAWLQRINSSHLLAPSLAARLADKIPAILVGGLSGKLPGDISAFPVSIAAGHLSIRSSRDSSALDLSPEGGLGIWQLGELAADTPAVLMDAWGSGGGAALEKVSEQMADSVWIEGGDVIIGDGASPVLTFATREASLPALAELPAAVARAKPAENAGAAEPANIKVSGVPANWMRFRWWVIGGLWLVLSAIIVWIFEQGRRRAS